MKINYFKYQNTLQLLKKQIYCIEEFLEIHGSKFVFVALSLVSVVFYLFFLNNNLGLAYNDARSHLDIGRRVVEGLTPGIAQLGSVWLPLPHLLMIPTIWSDFMWHSGLAGALISMISYSLCGVYIWLILKKISVPPILRIMGVSTFALNPNILYLQSTAMTELVLIFTLTAAIYELVSYFAHKDKYTLIKGAFWIMLATLVRYEGWFLFAIATALIFASTFREKGNKAAEGMLILFTTLSGFGIFMWFVWNKIIFGDFLYFALGPYSAHAQQEQLEAAGDLLTKGNILFSIKTYAYALIHTIGPIPLVGMVLGLVLMYFDNKITLSVKLATYLFLLSPVIFNMLALYLGHSVIFIEGLSGKSWFNVRYGVMALPAVAIFCAYLAAKSSQVKYIVVILFLLVGIHGVLNINNAVTIADAVYGSSGKDVSQIASWLATNANEDQSKILISAASHDAVIFSSGLDMKKIIHEGTGPFWQTATTTPDRWAKFIVMRTNDTNDSVFRSLQNNQEALKKYDIGYKGNFADIYVLKPEFHNYLAQNFSVASFGDWRKKENAKELKNAEEAEIVEKTDAVKPSFVGNQFIQSPASYFLVVLIAILIAGVSGLERLSKRSY